MRSWASNSYSTTTGRSASSLEDDGNSSRGWTNAPNVGNHVEQTHNRGQGNAPGPDAQSKSGSGDPGRVKANR
jgi:hypothetical protein